MTEAFPIGPGSARILRIVTPTFLLLVAVFGMLAYTAATANRLIKRSAASSGLDAGRESASAA